MSVKCGTMLHLVLVAYYCRGSLCAAEGDGCLDDCWHQVVLKCWKISIDVHLSDLTSLGDR